MSVVMLLLAMTLTGWPFGLISAQAADGPFLAEGIDYDTLVEAAAAVSNGGVITLTRDETFHIPPSGGWTELNESKAYTIDLNGKTLTADSHYESGIKITDGTVTIKNGNIKSLDRVSVVYVDGGDVTFVKLDIQTKNFRDQQAVTVKSGSLKILSGTYIGGEDAVFCEGGQVVITSGYFSTEDDGYDHGGIPDGCLVTSGTGTIILTPGSFADKPDWLNGASEVTILSFGASDITVKTQPRLIYTPGGTLDLSALVVTIHYNNGTSKDVPFSEFKEYDITTSFLNGEPVKLEHNGTSIEISWSGFKAYTDPLQVSNGSGVKVPQTGDYSNTMLWMFLGGASLLGIGLIIVGKRKYF